MTKYFIEFDFASHVDPVNYTWARLTPLVSEVEEFLYEDLTRSTRHRITDFDFSVDNEEEALLVKLITPYHPIDDGLYSIIFIKQAWEEDE